MTLICICLIGVSLTISLPLSWQLIGLGNRLGQIDRPDGQGHKQHTAQLPNTGGIAIALAVAVPIAAALISGWLIDPDGWKGWLGPLGAHVEGLRRQTPLAMAVLVALAVLHVMGLVDDRRGLSARFKLLVEVLVAATLAALFEIRIFQFLEELGPAGAAGSVILSTLWIVAIVNAMNMLDNMDGLAAGVGTIITCLYLAATLLAEQWFIAALCALLIGALLGFGVFNFPTAKLYMGDAGSLVVGLLLAVISVRTTYYQWPGAPGPEAPYPEGGPTGALDGSWYGMLMPIVVMAVPLYDMVTVSLIRLSQGRSPFVGDLNHFSHRLVRRGLSRHAAVIVIWLATAATGLGGVMFGSLAPWQALVVAAQAAVVVALLARLEF